MREIKFRVFNEVKMITSKHRISLDGEGVFIGDKRGCDQVLCPKAVLMQYTGLKDKNGVEIYEGDILKYFAEKDDIYGDRKYVMEFCCGSFCGRDSSSGLNSYPAESFNVHYLEVIGNIHQNPELMKEVR